MQLFVTSFQPNANDFCDRLRHLRTMPSQKIITPFNLGRRKRFFDRAAVFFYQAKTLSYTEQTTWTCLKSNFKSYHVIVSLFRGRAGINLVLQRCLLRMSVKPKTRSNQMFTCHSKNRIGNEIGLGNRPESSFNGQPVFVYLGEHVFLLMTG